MKLNNRTQSNRTLKRTRGFVLPVSLILLVILTGVVAAQMQRALMDERMAANSRENIVADSAAQTMLRWCELQLNNEPETVVTVQAPDRLATAAWKDSANWTPANTFTVTGVSLPGSKQHACLVERADDELAGGISDSGDPADPSGRARWLKYRITARVERATEGFDYAQSELRIFRQ
jgi:hypothetical protein